MIGKGLMIFGLILIIIGLIFYLTEEFNHLKWISWFGNLPGDIKIEKENFKVYFPITSMLIISIVVSIIIKILRRFI